MMMLVFYQCKTNRKIMFLFFKSNFKVGHESWTCITPLRLTKPCNPNKLLSLPKTFLHIFPHFHESFLFVYFIFGLVCNFIFCLFMLQIVKFIVCALACLLC